MAVSEKKSDHVIADITEKIAFASYLPLLHRATADNGEATPGFMIAEIEKLSYDFPHHNKQLAAYLSRRLEKPSPQVKLKVLKIIDHLIQEGHPNVRFALRKNDSSIKMTTMYNGVPDPLTGTTMYEKIRTDSKALLELLFSPERIQDDEKQIHTTNSRPQRPYLGALGSSTTNDGKYQGFGNSPRMKEETVTDKVLSYFDRFSTSSEQHSKIIRDGIASSVGKYEAVALPDQQILAIHPIAMPVMPQLSRSTSVRTHVPGKAGGGWEDSEDEMEESHFSQHARFASADSLNQVDENIPENSAENTLIKKFCAEEKFPVTWKELNEVCERCNELSGPAALQSIVEVLQKCPQTNILRALSLLDALLHTEMLATSRAMAEADQLLSKPLSAVCDDENLSELHKNKADKILKIFGKRVITLKS